MFRPTIVTMHITVGPADTTTPHYKDGDTVHTAREHPPLKQFSTNNSIDIFYFNVYIEPYI
jgi:hypothetical protein